MTQLIRFDWAMKNLLRDKANFGILEGFLSELLHFEVSILELLESESNQKNEQDKFNRVDLLVKDDKGELIVIEVQTDDDLDFLHRILYGTSKVIVEQMKRGRPYSEIRKVFSVNILKRAKMTVANTVYGRSPDEPQLNITYFIKYRLSIHYRLRGKYKSLFTYVPFRI